jgi:hypothetical protein
MEITHVQHLEHQEKLDLAIEKRDLVLISALGLIPFKDGNQWGFLYGKDLQSGVAGFGDTVRLAMCDFNQNFYNEKIKITNNN